MLGQEVEGDRQTVGLGQWGWQHTVHFSTLWLYCLSRLGAGICCHVINTKVCNNVVGIVGIVNIWKEANDVQLLVLWNWEKDVAVHRLIR